MMRVVCLLSVTAAAIGLVVFMAWNPEIWEPWLKERGIARDGVLFERGLKFLLVVILGAPLTALIHAIGRLGADRGRTDIHGYKVLRIRAGTLWFAVTSCMALSGLFFAYPALDPEASYPWLFRAAGVICLLFVPVLLSAKVRYDGATIRVPHSIGGSTVHYWSDLAEVRDVPEMKHYLLTFRDGKRASISYRYAGLSDLLATAERHVSGPSDRRGPALRA